jgi:hypothetical protein
MAQIDLSKNNEMSAKEESLFTIKPNITAQHW